MNETEFRELTYAYLTKWAPGMLGGQTLEQWHQDEEVGMHWGTALMHKPEFIKELQQGAIASRAEIECRLKYIADTWPSPETSVA